MAFIVIKLRKLPRTGGGRVTIWLCRTPIVRIVRYPRDEFRGVYRGIQEIDWQEAKKLSDCRMWMDGVYGEAVIRTSSA